MNLQQKTELASELIANAERQRKDAEATAAHYIGLANAALKPSTPTPRTDAAYAEWQESWDRKPFGPDLARTLERELDREREKVRVLRGATDLLMVRVNDELKSGRPALIAVQWHRIEPIIAALAATEDK